MEKNEAKLVKETHNYFSTIYEYECIECGRHYTRRQYNSRISPLCGKCKNVKDSEKAKIRQGEKKKEIWNNAVDEVANTIKDLYSFTIDEEKMIDEAIKEIKH